MNKGLKYWNYSQTIEFINKTTDNNNEKKKINDIILDSNGNYSNKTVKLINNNQYLSCNFQRISYNNLKQFKTNYINYNQPVIIEDEQSKWFESELGGSFVCFTFCRIACLFECNIIIFR